MSAKSVWVCITFICIIVFSWCVYRDVKNERLFTIDLRNRVVGARLQKDGRLPYFYKWRPQDGMRYYDGGNFDSLRASNITATPFFHDLMYPLADLSQRRISYIWTVIEYMLMLLCAVAGFSFAKTNLQKWAVLIAASLFLLTQGWIMHIVRGQMYILIPFFCLLFYYFLYHNKRLSYAFLAGCCAIAVILIRPNAIFFFLPFLLVIKNYSRRFIAVFLVPIIFLCCVMLVSKNQKAFWMEYALQIGAQIKFHQQLGPEMQINAPIRNIEIFEGWSRKQISEDYKNFHPSPHAENGNVYVIFRELFHVKTPVWLLFFLSFLMILVVFTAFWFYRGRNGGYALTNLAILGFCFYMITDLFSPVARWEYYEVQWLFLLMLAAANLTKSDKWFFWPVVAALFLNIIDTCLLKMEHSMGEYLLLIAFVVFAMKRKIDPVYEIRRGA